MAVYSARMERRGMWTASNLPSLATLAAALIAALVVIYTKLRDRAWQEVDRRRKEAIDANAARLDEGAKFRTDLLVRVERLEVKNESLLLEQVKQREQMFVLRGDLARAHALLEEIARRLDLLLAGPAGEHPDVRLQIIGLLEEVRAALPVRVEIVREEIRHEFDQIGAFEAPVSERPHRRAGD